MIRRVFIIWTHPLFHETVCLLLGHPQIEIVGTNSEYAAARGEMETLRPDTIIIEETGEKEAPTDTKVSWEILEHSSWNPRVIRLSLDDNELWVYHHERRTMKKSEDLLRLIQDT